MKLIYQFFYPYSGYLFFRCLENVFEEERNVNKKEISRGITTSSRPEKEDRKVKDQNDEILGFDHVLARLPLTLTLAFAFIDCF